MQSVRPTTNGEGDVNVTGAQVIKIILLAAFIILVALFSYYLALSPDVNAVTDPSRDYTTTLLSWLPMIVVIAIWVYFMARMRAGRSEGLKHLQRSQQHMEEVEKKLDQIVNLLKTRDR